MDDTIKGLPPEYAEDLLPSIQEEFVKTAKTLVVLDDDPTGTQTSYDVTVLTAWSVGLLTAELQKKPAVLFILTNSRSMSEQAAVQLTLEIGRNLQQAVKISGRQVVAVSRSDSTLRGHFPAEVGALAQALSLQDAAWILLPAFIEGRRFTLQDTHYIQEKDELIPVGSTPFARDAVFGYTHSDLKAWVEEKSKGSITAAEVASFSLEDIRLGGPQHVCEKLLACKPGQVCVVNACSFRDLEVFVMGVLLAEKKGKTFIYRTSATFVPIRAGMASGKTFVPAQRQAAEGRGSLVVVGSYVPKTTSQLEYLLAQGNHHPIEVEVGRLLRSPDASAYAKALVQEVDQLLASGKDVVVYTSRRLEVGKDKESSLQIHSMVSSFLVTVVQGLTVRPAFIVAKGGITSSDLASKALMAQHALILGQIIPGVPVWQMSPESRFPALIYVVFPGNVGDHTALAEVCSLLKNNKDAESSAAAG